MKSLFKIPDYNPANGEGWSSPIGSELRKDGIPVRCCWKPDLTGFALVDKWGFAHQFSRKLKKN